MRPPLTFEIQPYQGRQFADAHGQQALLARHVAALSSLPGALRLLSRSRPFSLAPLRRELRRQGDDLADLAALLDQLDRAEHDPAVVPALAAGARTRRTALRRAVARLPEVARIDRVLDDLAAERDDPAARAWLRTAAAPALWRWRWAQNQVQTLDVLAELAPPLAIDHFLLLWPEAARDPATLAQALRQGWLLPGVAPAALPRLVSGRYRERGGLLEPLEEGGDYLAVLTAAEVRGSWDYDNALTGLLMGDLPLTLAIDVETWPRATTRNKLTDAQTVLETTLNGPMAVADQRAKDALASCEYALERLNVQQWHQVHYAVLLGAPTPSELRRRVAIVRDQLAGAVLLDQIPGAQLELLGLFAPLPASTVRAPLVRHGTLSEALAVKLPWGRRKRTSSAGVLWGFDRDEGVPIIHDMWGAHGFENAHLMMIGKSGSGKTVALLTLALRHACAGTQVVFFDPLGKSRWLCEAVGSAARFYPVDTTAAINILDRAAPDLKRQRDVVARRLQALLGRVQIQGEEVRYIPRPLDNFALGALDRALQDARIYGAEGRRLPSIHPRNAPLLGDLAEALRRHAQHSRIGREVEAAGLLADEIESRLLGSSAHLFGAPTELAWHFDADVVGYDLSGADRELLPLYYESGFESLNAWVRGAARQAQYPHLLAVLDEYRIMASSGELEQHVGFATKSWRNYGGACWTADQNASTYFQAGDEWAGFISENTQLVMLGRQEGAGAETLERVYGHHLSPELLGDIRTAGAGEFVLLLGDAVHRVAFQLSDLEEAYFLQADQRRRRSYATA